MKKIQLLLAGAAMLVASLSSCNEGKRLAGQLEGAWSGNAQPISASAGTIATMTDTWTFVNDGPEGMGGSLVISSMASVECPLDAAANDSISPSSDAYAVTVAASVSINGTWDISAHDPDEDVIVSIDPKSLTVSVDPTGVAVSANGNPVTLDSIPQYLYSAAQAEIRKVAQQHFFPIDRLEDVEIKSDQLEFEIPGGAEGAHDIKVTLRKQGPVSK
ncbi:MAG: hypothetical protein NC342_09395 [Pseudoflavonifractor sp.]|nr:hypothetical protein [Alloprevotella sp.]MCM1117734.1 hypothetical protein [Pseudoflavonifractor sp.]